MTYGFTPPGNRLITTDNHKFKKGGEKKLQGHNVFPNFFLARWFCFVLFLFDIRFCSKIKVESVLIQSLFCKVEPSYHRKKCWRKYIECKLL